MFTRLFWKDLAERLIATLAQVALGLLGADQATSLDGETWLITLGIAGALVILKALAAGRVENTVSPASFAPAQPDLPAVATEEVVAEEPVFEEAVLPEATEPVVEVPMKKAAPRKRAPRKKTL